MNADAKRRPQNSEKETSTKNSGVKKKGNKKKKEKERKAIGVGDATDAADANDSLATPVLISLAAIATNYQQSPKIGIYLFFCWLHSTFSCFFFVASSQWTPMRDFPSFFYYRFSVVFTPWDSYPKRSIDISIVRVIRVDYWLIL